MAIKEELKELTSLKRKYVILGEKMKGALARGAEAEYSRYKIEYDAIGRTLAKQRAK